MLSERDSQQKKKIVVTVRQAEEDSKEKEIQETIK